MKVITARNVHEAIPAAALLMSEEGVPRDSRNGPVLVTPFPVATVYQKPCERVVFWSQRDANPFLHLYESLWMLAGRNDLEPLLRYTKQFAEYSDDGQTLWDAYGYRWRTAFQMDQVHRICERLKKDKNDRRCVLQMWDSELDLDRDGKAVPCNLTATFQCGGPEAHYLNMVVFNRSNDIVWGAYGANAVHFSMLQEFVAGAIGCMVGTYTQISVNWHAYQSTFDKIRNVHDHTEKLWNPYYQMPDPYLVDIKPLWMPTNPTLVIGLTTEILHREQEGCTAKFDTQVLWAEVIHGMFKAHNAWRTLKAPERFSEARRILHKLPQHIDWVRAGHDWLNRREARWLDKQVLEAAREHTTLGEA